VQSDADSTRRCSGKCHVPGVTAESIDVVADPGQRGPLIEETVVTRRGIVRIFGCERCVGQESEWPEAIVRGDDNRTGLFCEPLAVMRREVG
jgi:hypothetical protein